MFSEAFNMATEMAKATSEIVRLVLPPQVIAIVILIGSLSGFLINRSVYYREFYQNQSRSRRRRRRLSTTRIVVDSIALSLLFLSFMALVVAVGGNIFLSLLSLCFFVALAVTLAIILKYKPYGGTHD